MLGHYAKQTDCCDCQSREPACSHSDASRGMYPGNWATMGTTRGTSPSSKGLHIYSVSLGLTFIHIFLLTHSQTMGEAFLVKCLNLDTETAFRSEQRGFCPAGPIFSIDESLHSSFLCAAIMCMVETVCHSGIFCHLNVAQLLVSRGFLNNRY